MSALDTALTFIVRVLWVVLALSVTALVVQYATAPDYSPPGWRGTILGPDRTH